MFQEAAVSLSWQVELLPGLALKQVIVRVPMNHPEHIQKHRDVVSCELGVQGRNQGSFRDWLCKWSGARWLLIIWRPRLCRGLYQCADRLHGARTEDFGSKPHHRPACCSIPPTPLPVEEVGRVVGRIHTAASCLLQLVSALPLLALHYPLEKALYS